MALPPAQTGEEQILATRIASILIEVEVRRILDEAAANAEVGSHNVVLGLFAADAPGIGDELS